MNQTDELAGTLVLVHPELSMNPADRPGKIGVITATDEYGQHAYVGFGKSGQAIYAMDVLLVLKPSGAIQQLLREHAGLTIKEHTDLFRMALLQEYNPSRSNIKMALNLAAQSLAATNLGTRSLAEALGGDHEQSGQLWAGR